VDCSRPGPFGGKCGTKVIGDNGRTMTTGWFQPAKDAPMSPTASSSILLDERQNPSGRCFENQGGGRSQTVDIALSLAVGRLAFGLGFQWQSSHGYLAFGQCTLEMVDRYLDIDSEDTGQAMDWKMNARCVSDCERC
jgi:hypothetical protein